MVTWIGGREDGTHTNKSGGGVELSVADASAVKQKQKHFEYNGHISIFELTNGISVYEGC